MNVYVASWYDNAGFVREHVHEALRAFGIRPTSRWAEQARGPENFAAFQVDALRAIAADNDADLDRSDAVLMIATDGRGGESFAEVCRALLSGKLVVWVGRRTLSAFRRGVIRAEDLSDAFRILAEMARTP